MMIYTIRSYCLLMVTTSTTKIDFLCQTLADRRRGRDCLVVRFTTTYIYHITTNDVSSNRAHGEVYSIQHYVIKIVSDL